MAWPRLWALLPVGAIPTTVGPALDSAGLCVCRIPAHKLAGGRTGWGRPDLLSVPAHAEWRPPLRKSPLISSRSPSPTLLSLTPPPLLLVS